MVSQLLRKLGARLGGGGGPPAEDGGGVHRFVLALAAAGDDGEREHTFCCDVGGGVDPWVDALTGAGDPCAGARGGAGCRAGHALAGWVGGLDNLRAGDCSRGRVCR